MQIFELSHSPRLQDRKVFSFTFPSQSSTVQTAEAAVLATSLPGQLSTPQHKTSKANGKGIAMLYGSPAP